MVLGSKAPPFHSSTHQRPSSHGTRQPLQPRYSRPHFLDVCHDWNESRQGSCYKSGGKYPIQFAFPWDFPGVRPNEIINDDFRAWPAWWSHGVKRRDGFCFTAHPSRGLIQAGPWLFSAVLSHKPYALWWEHDHIGGRGGCRGDWSSYTRKENSFLLLLPPRNNNNRNLLSIWSKRKEAVGTKDAEGM